MEEGTINLKWDKRYMNIAKECSSWSKDPSTKVGSYLVIPSGARFEGYNGFPKGIKDLTERLENREIKYDYTIHAEVNSILKATRGGFSPKGSTIYVYGLPVCSSCANLIIQVGVERVVCQINIPEDDEEFMASSKFKWYESWRDHSEPKFAEAGIRTELWIERIRG